MKLFGFEFKRKTQIDNSVESFAPPNDDDGAIIITEAPGGFGAYSTVIDMDGIVRNEADLITKYRDVAQQPEVDSAIDEIVNEAITLDVDQEVVDLVLDEVQVSDKIKQEMVIEFKEILKLLEFNNQPYDVFRRWYIDGRIYYHVIIDEGNPKLGIKELRYIDPRKIRKVREVKRIPIRSAQGEAVMQKTVNEFYVFNEKGFSTKNTQPGLSTQPGITGGLKISRDSIVLVSSGLTDSNGLLVLSYLQKAIRETNQLRTLENAAIIYRLSRAPERRIWYVDVGNLPKMKAEQYMKDIMTKHKNRLVYDIGTGEIRDDRKYMCYALDTRIPLLDGRTLTLQEIIDEFKNGKTNWAYSCDPKTGKFAPGPVSWAGITKKNSEVVRVTFDNGKSVVCTPDHKFPVWNKGFVEAKDIVGESIIPGYRRMNRINNSGREYEQIYLNDEKAWKFTHREVSKWKDQVGIPNEMVHSEKYANEDKRTIHHRDYNGVNNSPKNLVRMNRNDHMQYHWDCTKFGANRRPNKSEDFTPEWRMNLAIAAKNRIPKCKTWKIITPNNEQLIIENLSAFCRDNNLNRSNIKGQFGSKKFFAEELVNHKAISVEWLDQKIDVGCISIDGDETYHSHHTYLLDAGVYTKNTMLEDYWLPRREGGRGTQVDILPGGQNLGEMDDVLYFQKQLYRALNVPVTRLDSESLFDIGRATQISRDEIKFSKFIDRLRTRFTKLFLSLMEKQLILKGIATYDDWVTIKDKIKFRFARDNYFAELKEDEIMSNRFQLLEAAFPYIGRAISWRWARKNILRQDDEEMEQMDQEIAQELLNPQFNTSVLDPDQNGMGESPDLPPMPEEGKK
jgi:hypothetical protein